MNIKHIKILGFSLLAGATLCLFGILVHFVHPDLFWAIVWFALISAFIEQTKQAIERRGARIALYGIAAATGIIWMIVNTSVYELISSNITTNPYGDYFIEQFTFRLSLSVFILKIISKAWLSDIRVTIVIFLFLARLLVARPLFQSLLRKTSHRHFEFVAHSILTIHAKLITFLGSRFALFLLNALLWGLAAFFLRFDNYVILTAIMAISALTPVLGLFLAAALSLVYVESGLFLLQLGGICIATASVWFVDYTLIKQSEQTQTGQVFFLLCLPPLGYLLFSYPGLFAAAPLAMLSHVVGRTVYENLPLIHRSV